MRILRKSVSVILILIMIFSVFAAVPFEVSAASLVSYLCYSWDGEKVVGNVIVCDSAELSERTSDELDSCTYAVSRDTTVNGRLVVSGTTDLVLCDGATLTLKEGITVQPQATLNIFGQSDGTGKIYAHMDRRSRYYKCAIIGGGDSMNSGDIYIHGGTFDLDNGEGTLEDDDIINGFAGACIGGGKNCAAGEVVIYGGDITVHALDGAGIGGGKFGQASWKQGESIRIYGGKIDAFGYGSAAIGNGEQCDGSVGGIAVYGGEVTAKGVAGSAGIGGGGAVGSDGTGGSNGPITIYGGTITASGTGSKASGAGIGSGGKADQSAPIRILGGTVVCLSQRGAGIGSGANGNAGEIEIKNANVAASSFSWGAGVGSGYEGNSGEITITDSTVSATSCNYGSAQDFLNAFDKMVFYRKMKANDQAFVDAAVNAVLLLVELFQKDYSGAAIGGGRNGNGGRITIKNSTIEAECGNYAAAIGGGQGKGFDTITIDHSTIVKANSGCDGAGIGSGDEADSGGTINIINGSDVKAAAGNDAAAIGTGDDCDASCTINISDSTVEAHGGRYGAGIGGGDDTDGGTITISNSTVTADSKTDGAGIGGGESGNGGTISITNNSNVTATGGGYAAGIGGGDHANGGSIIIDSSTVRAYGGTDAAGIGGGEDGDGGHIEIRNGSNVYAKGKSYGSGIGGGEDGDGEYCSIDGSSTVEAVAGADGWGVSIGYGDYALLAPYNTGSIVLNERSLVNAGKSESDAKTYSGSERWNAIWSNKYAKIYTCEHADTYWRYDPDSISSNVYHYKHCKICGRDIAHEEHDLDENNICTKCHASAVLYSYSFVEQNSAGIISRVLRVPGSSYITAPECTNAPDGYEFICWSDNRGEYYEPGDQIKTWESDAEVLAIYYPVSEVSYIAANGEEKTVLARRIQNTGSTAYLSEGWYVVDENTEIGYQLTYKGNVRMIIADGATLSFSQFLSSSDYCIVTDDRDLNPNIFTVFGQSGQTGTIDLGVRKAYFYDLDLYGGNIRFLNSGSEGYGWLELYNDCTVNKGTLTGDVLRCQSLIVNGGNTDIGQSITDGTVQLGWNQPTDSVRIGSLITNSVSIREGQTLTDGTGQFSGAVDADQIEGRTLTPYIPHDYDGPEWVWSNEYQDATAVFCCRDCGDIQEIRAKVTVVDSGRNRTATARCDFNGQEYTAVQTFRIIFDVNTAECEHGTVTADRTEARADEIITLDIVPDDGYRLFSLTVTDSDHNEVENDGSSFTMPESDVTVAAVFARYAERVEPTIDENGAYILGTVEHYEANGECYAVNADGSIGAELDDISLSYFDFVLTGDSYRINYYTGPTGDLAVLEIPESFDGRPISSLGNYSNKPIIDYDGKQKTQFELLLNGNITEIRPYALYAMWVTKVTGDTSGLSRIGSYAFSWANSPDDYTLDIKLDYPGRISVGSEIFNNMNVTARIRHATTFSSNSFSQRDIDYIFTDAHPYGDPTWTWSADNSAATATFTCTDSRCRHQETVEATVTREITDGTGYHAASVELDGRAYTDQKQIDYFVGHSLTLNGSIGVNFYLDLTEQELADGATVDFEWTVDGNKKTESVTLTADDKYSCGYKASCPVAVAEMTYDVTATLTIGSAKLSETDTYSAQRYAQVILTNDEFRDYYVDLKGQDKYDQLVTLVQAMLDYGSKAQIRFARNTEHPANGGTDYFSGEETITSSAGDMEEYLGDCGLEYVGTSVIYLSQTTLRHYYRIVEADKFTDDIRNGVTFDGKAVTCGEKKGMIYFDRTDIAASQLDTEYVLKLNGHEYHYSALDYSALSYSSDETPYEDSVTKQLAASVYRYNRAAKAFFED